MDSTPRLTQRTITATEFKAKCLDILDQVASHQIERVTITKRGKIVGILMPPEPPPGPPESLWGCMKGTFWIDPNCDLTEPVIEMEEWYGDLPEDDVPA